MGHVIAWLLGLIKSPQDKIVWAYRNWPLVLVGLILMIIVI